MRTVGLPNTTEQLRTNYLLKNFLQEVISLLDLFLKKKSLNSKALHVFRKKNNYKLIKQLEN